MIDWLLDIDRLDLSDPGVRFGWAHPLPGYAWVLIALAAVLLAVISYRGLSGHAVRRALFGAARAALLVLLMVMLAGPRLERPNERTEPDWVVVLADRSGSMTIGDGPGGRSREADLVAAFDAGLPVLSELSESRRVLTLGFDAGVFDLQLPTNDEAFDPGRPDGRRTLLGRAMDLALDRVAARPVAGVVVLSDGASGDAVSRRALQRLRSERIPVFTVALGSSEPAGDIAIASAEAPAAGFVRDRLPVRVALSRTGPASTSGATLELVERSTGLVLDSRRITADETEATLIARPEAEGDAVWDIRLIPDGSDLLVENNLAEVAVSLVDRPLRVLMADGYPRWEFRYLKNLLLRETSISSSSLLLSTGRRHTQEGDVLLSRMPTSPGEWEPFDVLVLGDFRADLLSEEQQIQIRDLVAERGAGLLWIAGPGATPSSWRGTPLEPLLPMSLGEGTSVYGEPVTMLREPASDRLGLLQLGDTGGWPERLSDPDTGWSLLRWAQRIDPSQLKPTAMVLGSLRPTVSGSDPTPGVMTMRFGAGRVVYVATDEIWRWRYARGEALPERFWVPLVRLLGREGLARSGRSALLEVAPRRTDVGATASVEVTLLDARLVEASPTTIAARVTDESGTQIAELVLRSDEPTGRARRFATTWVAPGPGTYTVETDDPSLGGERLDGTLEVIASDDERKQPETDHAMLASLSERTDGRVLTPTGLTELAELLPNRERRVLGTPDIETLWDTPLALLFVVCLLCFEWIGRRLSLLA